jgi:hypothetical protein
MNHTKSRPQAAQHKYRKANQRFQVQMMIDALENMVLEADTLTLRRVAVDALKMLKTALRERP